MSSPRLVVDFSMDEFRMTFSVASSEKQNQHQLFLIDKGYYLFSHFPLHFLTSRMGKKKSRKLIPIPRRSRSVPSKSVTSRKKPESEKYILVLGKNPFYVICFWLLKKLWRVFVLQGGNLRFMLVFGVKIDKLVSFI